MSVPRLSLVQEDYARACSVGDALLRKASKLSNCLIDCGINNVTTILIDDINEVGDDGVQHKVIRIITKDGCEHKIEMNVSMCASTLYYQES